jgi:hypothetical protein
MEAAVSNNSSIKLNFGEQAHKGAPTPFRLSLTLDLFSEEVIPCLSRKTKSGRAFKNALVSNFHKLQLS